MDLNCRKQQKNYWSCYTELLYTEHHEALGVSCRWALQIDNLLTYLLNYNVLQQCHGTERRRKKLTTQKWAMKPTEAEFHCNVVVLKQWRFSCHDDGLCILSTNTQNDAVSWLQLSITYDAVLCTHYSKQIKLKQCNAYLKTKIMSRKMYMSWFQSHISILSWPLF